MEPSTALATPSTREILAQQDATPQVPHRVNLLYDAEANLYVVEVRDPDSGDIIRQIPPEELVKFRQHAKEFLGRLIDCLL